ncbi:hypothetical protein EXM25_20505 [Mycobacteroides abscessus subsp. massiliense]|nr:hypothetical protein EXM25_20505 [Mycobacteroides abscessus subsp. massiliense]QBE84363.1 hypothetical protein EXM27_20460 [Mycobacteroides abscessus subsp. massiliense]
MYSADSGLNPNSGRPEFILYAPTRNIRRLSRNESDGCEHVCELVKPLNSAMSATSSSYLTKILSKIQHWVTTVTSSSGMLCCDTRRWAEIWLLSGIDKSSTHAAGPDLVYSCVRLSQQIGIAVTILDLRKHVNGDVLAN